MNHDYKYENLREEDRNALIPAVQVRKPLTKEQFRAQFDTEVVLQAALKNILTYEQTMHGYKIYRCLNKIVLEDGGKHYMGGLDEMVTDGHHRLAAARKAGYPVRIVI